MTHLDEGTIHAWLDGALSDAEALEVSGHAASCAECAAKVAEARGFIAGASRILASLDDVPAGISPKRSPVAASTLKPRSFWQAAPWVTGIAAALMLAIGVKEWRERPSAQTAFAPVEPLRMDSLRAALPTQATPVDSSLRVRSVSAPQAKPLSVPPPPVLRRRVADASAGVAGTLGMGAADAAQRQMVAPNRKEAMLAESAPLRAAIARKDERQLAGCIRVEVLDVREIPSGGAAAKSVAAAKTPAPASNLAAKAAPASASTAPSMFLLDTTMTPRGRVIRSQESGEAIGNWFAAGGDSIRLVMPPLRTFTLPASSRVPCQQNP